MERSPQPTDGIRLDARKVPREGLMLDLEPDSATLVVAFAGLKGFLGGFPAFEFRRVLSSVEVKSVFVRDHWSAWYHRGVLDVGPGIDSVVAKLGEVTRGARRVVMIGNSAGGYASLLFGALLGCEAYAFSPQTSISPDFLASIGDHRWDEELEALIASGCFDERYGDLAPVLGSSEATFEIFYGALDPYDEAHVARVQGLPSVSVNRIEDCDHRVVRHLRDSGWLLAFLEGMRAGGPGNG